MRKVIVDGIEIKFNDLTEEKQRELYTKNRAKYRKEASESIYMQIRRMVARDEKSSDFLKQMLQNEVNGYDNSLVKDEIYNNEVFEITEEIIKLLAASNNWENRKKAAELSKNSEFLNQMLRNGVKKEDDSVEDAIYNNEAFEIEEETIKVLAASGNIRKRKKAAELSKDSKFLNEMLREEEFLNQMLREEVNGKNNVDVVDAIFNNEAFEIEEETIKVLAASSEWQNRQKAAKLSKDSQFLCKILIDELNGDNDINVEKAIINNPAFMKEKARLKELIHDIK